MRRFALDELLAWKERQNRKPLVLRGARQVGKSYLVRELAGTAFEDLVELNFERDPELGEFLRVKRPNDILQQLELRFDRAVVPGRTLLFLDEIQAAPHVLAVLRYFHEELPALHVVAAGSLFDLALRDPQFSVPVGRVEYLHLGPMTFEEFLLALGRERLCAYVQFYRVGQEVPRAIHDELMRELRRFLMVGGMPEAVATYARSQSLRECDRVKHSLLATFQDDFAKYGARTPAGRLRKVFQSIPHTVGEKLKYANIDRGERAKDLAAALELLSLARVCHVVRHTTGDGVPLGATTSARHFKVLFLDVGLAAAASGLSMLEVDRVEDPLVNAGGLCEQHVGQHLLYAAPPWQEPALHYWMRESRNSSAEVDYLIACGAEVVPVEVKSGKTGTLKSLHLFLREKRRSLGVRVNSEPPSLLDATTSLADGQNVPFRLLSLPLYMAGQIQRLSAEVMAS